MSFLFFFFGNVHRFRSLTMYLHRADGMNCFEGSKSDGEPPFAEEPRPQIFSPESGPIFKSSVECQPLRSNVAVSEATDFPLSWSATAALDTSVAESFPLTGCCPFSFPSRAAEPSPSVRPM